MRDLAEIQRAHDIIAAFLAGHVVEVTEIDLDTRMAMAAACSALCWILGDAHPPSDLFAQNLAGLERVAKANGGAFVPRVN